MRRRCRRLPPTPIGAVGAESSRRSSVSLATSTSPRRPRLTRSCWRCVRGPWTGCRARWRPGCSRLPGAARSTVFVVPGACATDSTASPSAYPDTALGADADVAEPIIADDELRLGRAVLPSGARCRGPGRPDDAAGVRGVNGIDRRRVPRADGDDGGSTDTSEEADRRIRRRHRTTRRRGGGRTNGSGTSHDPPRVHDGTHGRVGGNAARRRPRRQRPSDGQDAPRPPPR